MKVFFRGQLLTQAHLDILAPLLNEELSEAQLKKKAAEKFQAAGIPIPPLAAGQAVNWETKGVSDSGTIISVDERACKVRVHSKAKNRPFTVAERDIRV